MNRRTLILSTFAVSGAAFLGAAWNTTRPTATSSAQSIAPEIAEALIRSHSPILGNVDAPVTIVEFFDPACEACRAFHPIVKDLLAEHGGAVRVVLRYTPFHGEGSEQAILILEAARMQNVFEPVLEALLIQQPKWASHGRMQPAFIPAIAESAGLDLEAARTQVKAPEVIAALNQDRADVETVGVRQTPTFFVNGKPLDPFGEGELRALVAAEVAATGG